MLRKLDHIKYHIIAFLNFKITKANVPNNSTLNAYALFFFLSCFPLITYAEDLRIEHFGVWENVFSDPLPFPANAVRFINNKYYAVGDTGTIASSDDGYNWIVHSEKRSNQEILWDVTYGNGVYVATGAHGTILSSTDGCNWTRIYIGTSHGLSNVNFINGMFIAVGTLSIATSTDGVNWKLSIRDEWMKDIAYANGIYVTIGLENKISTTEDLENWTPRSLGVNIQLQALAYGNGTFVAMGYKFSNETRPATYTSEDGILWKSHNQPYGAIVVRDIIFDGTYFIAVGQDGFYALSIDGVEWNYIEGFTPDIKSVCTTNSDYAVLTESNKILRFHNPTSPDVSSIQKLGDVNVLERANDYVFARSTLTGSEQRGSSPANMLTKDGENWAAIPLPNDEKIQTFSNFGGSYFAGTDKGNIYMMSDDERLIPIHYNKDFIWGEIVAAKDNLFAFASRKLSAGINSLYRSEDGVIWEKVDSFPKNINISDCIYENELFVAGGRNMTTGEATIITSSDGIDWAERLENTGLRQELNRVVYGNGSFFATDGSSVFTSPNGLDWDEANLPTNESYLDIAYGNEKFIVLTDQGRVATSDNGISWDIEMIDSPYPLTRIIWTGSQFLASGEIPTSFARSANGVTWTVRDASPDGLVRSMSPVKNGLAAVTEDGSLLISEDNGPWKSLQVPGFEVLHFTAYKDGRYVVVGENSSKYGSINKFATSTDLVNWIVIDNIQSTYVYGMRLINNKFFAYGNQLLATSEDGQNWTNHFKESDETPTLQGIAFGQGIYIAYQIIYNSNASIFSSADGISWTETYTLPSTWTSFNRIAYGNGRFVILLGNVAIFSDNGVDWVQYDPNLRGVVEEVSYGRGYFFASSLAGQGFLSTNGESWQSIATGISNRSFGAIFSNETFWAYGLGGLIAKLKVPESYIEPEANDLKLAVSGLGLTVPIRAELMNDDMGSLGIQAISASIDIGDFQVYDKQESQCSDFPIRAALQLASNTTTDFAAKITYALENEVGDLSNEGEIDIMGLMPLRKSEKQRIALSDSFDFLHLDLPIGNTNSIGNLTRGPSNGEAIVLDRSIQYFPSQRFWELGEDQITVRLKELETTENAPEASFSEFTIRIESNTNTEARDDYFSVQPNSISRLDVLANDRWDNQNPSQGIDLILDDTIGTATLDINETPNDHTDDTIVYENQVSGLSTDSFSYEIRNEDGSVNRARVFITVGENLSYDDWRNATFGNTTDPIGERLVIQPGDSISNFERYLFGLKTPNNQQDSERALEIELLPNRDIQLTANIAQSGQHQFSFEAYTDTLGWHTLDSIEGVSRSESEPYLNPHLLKTVTHTIPNTDGNAYLFRTKALEKDQTFAVPNDKE